MAGEPELIKVRLTDEGEDSETPWAHDLGPAPGPPGSRKVRLVNVPFMHAKPTWGDVIIVTPVEDDFPVWDRGGVAWEQIGTRIAEDGGRWAMIVDYAAHMGSKDAFRALAEACAELEIVCEGAWGPRDGKPGRAYLAVKHELDDVAVMNRLRGAKLPCELIQIHPSPVAAPAVSKPAVSKPAVSKPALSKPALPKPVVSRPAAAKSVTKKSAANTSASPSASAPKRATKTAAKIASKRGSAPADSKPTISTPRAKQPATNKAATKKPATKTTVGKTQRSRPTAKATTSKPAHRR